MGMVDSVELVTNLSISISALALRRRLQLASASNWETDMSRIILSISLGVLASNLAFEVLRTSYECHNIVAMLHVA
jgi:hypothetical protein